MDISLAFITGLLSSLHCAGMCGPLVLAYSAVDARNESEGGRYLLSHLIYNAGRILSYAIVGAALGLVGGSVSTLRGVGFWFSFLAGILTIAFGLVAFRRGFSFGDSPSAGSSAGASRMLERVLSVYRKSFGALISRGGLESKFYIGLLTPLLPCGLLYGMFIRSAGTGDPVEGALMMAAFGAGIVPALIGAGLVATYLSGRVRSWAERIAALMLVLMGASLIWRALMAGMGHH